MAKVNEGSISFDFDNTTNEELLTQVLNSIHTSQVYVKHEIDSIFHKNDKIRTSYYVETSDEPIVESPKWQNSFLNNMKADYLFKSIMGTISMYNDLMSKKAMIITFMGSGYHVMYPEEFKLRTDLTSDRISEADMQRINSDNEYINNIIESFTYDAEQKGSMELSRILEDIRTKYGAAISDTISSDLGTEIYIQSAYNIRAKISRYCSDESYANYVEHIDTDGTLERWEVIDDIMNMINESRAIVDSVFKPTQKALCPVFEISDGTCRSRRNDCMKELTRVYGMNLTREVIDNNGTSTIN